MQEELLAAWLELSTAVCNQRIVSDMTYNEARICNLLKAREKQYGGAENAGMTASELCKRTKILKSQMHGILSRMEKKGIILRKRSEKDARCVNIFLNEEKIDLYSSQHTKIIAFIDEIIENFSGGEVRQIIDIFNAISDIANRIQDGTAQKEGLT